MPEFVLDRPCDWTVSPDGQSCGVTPTANPGDIYYACEEHYDDVRDWLDQDGEA